jgi:hypothetical protein
MGDGNMDWTEIELSIPHDVLDLYKEIAVIDRKVMIAGGFLSDLYMGKPFGDIDFFLRYRQNHATAIHKCMLHLGASVVSSDVAVNEFYKGVGAFSVRSYVYLGYKIQFVYNEQGEKSADYFDFRFREFKYTGGKAYASKAALEDIAQKRLVIRNYIAPLRALERLCRFEIKYGFTPEEMSVDLLQYFLFKDNRFNADTLSAFSSLIIDPVVRERFTFFLESFDKTKTYSTYSEYIYIILCFQSNGFADTRRDVVDYMISLNDEQNRFEKSFSLSGNLFGEELSDRLNDFRQYVKTKRLSLLLELDYSFFETLLTIVECPDDELLSFWRMYRPMILNFYPRFNDCDRAINAKHIFDSPVSLTYRSFPGVLVRSFFVRQAYERSRQVLFVDCIRESDNVTLFRSSVDATSKKVLSLIYQNDAEDLGSTADVCMKRKLLELLPL